ncbi:ATP-binding protein [Saccharomonospora sp. NPDC046836]|uniref:AAA family ATPase n=1 Tax=Saccharomonospora sp. NPDC046836 TaxID=3156921 RepID=UPI00340EC03D
MISTLEQAMLLRFRTSNHRSLRDPAELSLASSAARGAVPADKDWLRATTRVAGIYGANASGKSTVLDAIDFLVQAVANSATIWAKRKKFPYRPFKLDDHHRQQTSTYEVDFVVDGTRYNYGFESNHEGIHEEWLNSYPHARPRLLFHRVGLLDSQYSFGRTLPGQNVSLSKMVGPKTLFLSFAANSQHPLLNRLADALVGGVSYAAYNENDRNSRLRWIKQAIEDPELLREAESLLRLADLGISSIKLHQATIDDKIKQKFARIFAAINEGDDERPPEVDMEDILKEISSEIRFSHSGANGENSGEPLSISDASSGTIAWLTIGVPAINCLKNGQVLLIDEIDASLHPLLSSTLIKMFKDESVNKLGAQLIFTSHDVSLIGKLVDQSLGSDEVWFTEKDRGSASQLYSLHEFEVRKDDNFERRYMQGRYGAVPMVDAGRIKRLLEKVAH